MVKQYDGTFRVIGETADRQNYPVRPADIKTRPSALGLLSTFGKAEVEKAAERIVHFFQARGYWSRFTLDELFAFYASRGWDTNAPLFGLAGAWYDDGDLGSWREPADVFIASDPWGHLYVTDRFIDRCAAAIDRAALDEGMKKLADVLKGAIESNGTAGPS